MSYCLIERNYSTGEFKAKEVEVVKESAKTITIMDKSGSWSNEQRFSKSELNSHIEKLFTSREDAVAWFKDWKDRKIAQAKLDVERYERMEIK